MNKYTTGLSHEKSIVINVFKVGIVEVVRKAREGLLSDKDELTPNDDCCDDPFDDLFESCTELAD